MPMSLYLQEFGSQVWAAFGCLPYHVGSSLRGKTWRDVDVRVILEDAEYKAMGFGHPDHPHQNLKWVAMVMAFSALGKQITGLLIDFQIQQQTKANKESGGEPRSALGIIGLRMKDNPSDRDY